MRISILKKALHNFSKLPHYSENVHYYFLCFHSDSNENLFNKSIFIKIFHLIMAKIRKIKNNNNNKRNRK